VKHLSALRLVVSRTASGLDVLLRRLREAPRVGVPCEPEGDVRRHSAVGADRDWADGVREEPGERGERTGVRRRLWDRCREDGELDRRDYFARTICTRGDLFPRNDAGE